MAAKHSGTKVQEAEESSAVNEDLTPAKTSPKSIPTASAATSDSVDAIKAAKAKSAELQKQFEDWCRRNSRNPKDQLAYQTWLGLR